MSIFFKAKSLFSNRRGLLGGKSRVAPEFTPVVPAPPTTAFGAFTRDTTQATIKPLLPPAGSGIQTLRQPLAPMPMINPEIPVIPRIVMPMPVPGSGIRQLRNPIVLPRTNNRRRQMRILPPIIN